MDETYIGFVVNGCTCIAPSNGLNILPAKPPSVMGDRIASIDGSRTSREAIIACDGRRVI